MQSSKETVSSASSNTIAVQYPSVSNDHRIPPKHPRPGKGVLGELQKHQQRRVEIDELDKAIGKLNQSINASSYQLLLLIREFDERAGWAGWSFPDGVSWLKWRCDLGAGTAREKLRIAHALKELPLISGEFAAGKLSYSKVRVMTRVATSANESELIEMARRMTVCHLAEHCKQRSNASPSSTALAKNAHESRSYRVWHDQARGTVHVSLEIPVEEGELLEKAVEKAAVRSAKELGTTHHHADTEPSWSSLQADAMVNIMREFLGSSDGSHTKSRSSSADHYQVMVHVDEDALNKNESDVNSQYPIESVRRLCCDGSIIPIVENAKGEPLNVGRKVRTITTAINRALWSRDRGCAFPGCSHTRFVDAHHIKHWADGGETSVDNLVLLCSSHHKLVHEGGYSVMRDHRQELFFKRPDGKAVPDCGFYKEDWIDADLATSDENYITGQNSNARAFSADGEIRDGMGIYSVH